ncbi:hypothetical protein [Pseudoroseomonas ludipueritiae]|uniref:Uncharacterized protein n=1 Tax=Pseudoroseomonas ludipueritiae TaxID=198093 RepID=A0ABR7R303_9PROT|nr:hypothetical protein [Pseudoroseomonas ludipueritiae]MBC9176137.1 hypothetical protein [Pseudoroseomonas ludipueritiae]
MIVGSSAAATAAVVPITNAATPTDLFVETSYEGDRLTTVLLRLGPPNARGSLSVRLRADDFDPIPKELVGGKPFLQLRGLVRRPEDNAVDCKARLIIDVIGADLFNLRTGNDGRRPYYRFEVWTDPCAAGKKHEAPHPWFIRLITNVWRNPGGSRALNFPEQHVTGDERVRLDHFAAGLQGLELILAGSWVQATLSAVLAKPVRARGLFHAEMRQEAVAGVDAPDGAPEPSLLWTVHAHANSSATLFDGFARFGVARFGWLTRKDPKNERPRFHIAFGSNRYAPPDDVVTLAVTPFAASAANKTVLTVPAAAVTVRSRARAALETDSGRRTVTVAFEGPFGVLLHTGTEQLAALNIDALFPPSPANASVAAAASARTPADFEAAARAAAVEAETPRLVLGEDGGGRWALALTGVIKAGPIDGHLVVTVVDPVVDPLKDVLPPPSGDEPLVRLATRAWGPLRLLPDPQNGGAGAPPQAARKVRLDVVLGERVVNAFSLRARLAGLPFSLVDDPAGVCELVRRAPQRLRPLDDEIVLALQAVPIAGFDKFVSVKVETLAKAGALQQHGVIEIDGPRTPGKGGLKAAADVPLDDFEVKVRRARDHTVLDVRFANMRLRDGLDAGEPLLLPNPVLDPADTLPVTRNKLPVVMAVFASQHVAEQAYLRTENPGISPPDIPWLELATHYPSVADVATVREKFAALRTGRRSEKAKVRIELRRYAAKWLDDLRAMSAPPPDVDALRSGLQKFADFATLFDAQATQQHPLPSDQTIYIGSKDLDPDASALAWDVLSDQSGGQEAASARLKGRLFGVEAWHSEGKWSPPEKTSNNHLVREAFERFAKPDPTVRTAFEQFAGELKTTVHQIEGYNASIAQERLTEIKERVAFDYKEFRDFWREKAIRSDSAAIKEASDFISTWWANNLVGKAKEFADNVFAEYTQLSGEGRDPFKGRTRARFSGSSRLAFSWIDPSTRAPAVPQPFALKSLLDWRRREAATPLRARVLRKREADGTLARFQDDAEMLHMQGFPPRDLGTVATHTGELYAHAAKAPLPDESVIELPFRLQLAAAQDATWVQPQPVALGVSTGEEPLGVPLPQSVPIWSVSLSPEHPPALLRAIWSDDFRPATFLRRLAIGLRPGGDAASATRINTVYDPPPRGARAPWALPSIQLVDGKVVEKPITGPDAVGPSFRTSMDAFDRDQLVKLSSVHGMRTSGTADPKQPDELRKDSSVFAPPPGHALIDLELNETSKQTASAIYRPKALDFRELRLTALGGTLDLDTAFQPPAAARTRARDPIYEPLVLQRWRHRAVIGRDIHVELVYKGYLFPFGSRATLTKITERRYDGRAKIGATGRGPTAYLVQRFFIRCSEPVKESYDGQPDDGRGWPCRTLTICTEKTPDLVDPLEGQSDTGSGPLTVSASGRIAVPDGRGLAFWPRTAPHEGGNVAFEFRIDSVPQKLRMPLIFVDAIAADDRNTVARLADYYNSLPSGIATETWDPNFDPSSPRVCMHGGAARQYAKEIAEGDTTYETLAWTIGVEGRPGVQAGVTPPSEEDTAALCACTEGGAPAACRVSADKPFLEQRGVAIGRRRENFDFAPILRQSDQPPFYPFIQFAVLRLDRIARLIGQRTGNTCVAAFDGAYLRSGLPKQSADGTELADERAPRMEVVLNILTPTRLEAGNRGDRVGGIGRPAGWLTLLSRRNGPLTLKEPLQHVAPAAPPEFSCALLMPRAQMAALAAPLPSWKSLAGNEIVPAQFVPPEGGESAIKRLIELILGDDDCLLLGVFKLSEVISATISATDIAPLIRETMEYGAAAQRSVDEAIEFIRNEVIARLRDLAADIETAFNEADVSIAGKALELSNVYPAVASAITELRLALQAVEGEANAEAALKLVTRIPTAGRNLLEGLDAVARDPISPLKLELSRLFSAELGDVTRFLAWLEQLRAFASADFAEVAARAVLGEVRKELRERLGTGNQPVDLDAVAPIVDTIVPFLPGSEAPRVTDAARRTVARIIRSAVDAAFANGDDLRVVLINLGKFDLAAAARAAARTEFAGIAADSWDEVLDGVDEQLATVATLKSLDAEIRRLAARVDELAGLIPTGEELRQTYTELKLQAEQQLAKSLDELARNLLGLSLDDLRTTGGRIQQTVEILGGSAPLEAKIGAALNFAKELDKLILGSSFAAELDTLAVAVLERAIRAAANLLSVGLEVAAFLAREATPGGGTIAAPAALLKAIDAASIKVGRLDAEAGSATVAAVDAAIRDVNDAFGSIVAGDAALRFTPLVRFLAEVLRAERDFYEDFGNEPSNALKAVRTGLALVRGTVVAGFRRFAATVGRADVAARDLTVRITAARSRIAAVQNAPTLANLDALVDDYPHEAILNVLAVWPQIAQDTFTIASDCAGTIAMAAKSVSDGITSATDAQKAALEILAGRTEVSAARFEVAALTAGQAELTAIGEALAATSGNALATALAAAHEVLGTVAPNDAVSAELTLFRPAYDILQARFLKAFDELTPESIAAGVATLAGAQVKLESEIAAVAAAPTVTAKLEAATTLRKTLKTAFTELKKSVVIPLEMHKDGNAVRTAVYAGAARAAAALQGVARKETGRRVIEARNWLIEGVFSQGRLGDLVATYRGVVNARTSALDALTGSDGKLSDTGRQLARTLQLVGLAGDSFDPRFLFVAVQDPQRPIDQLVTEKEQLLAANATKPKDFLATEENAVRLLNTGGFPEAKLTLLRGLLDTWQGTTGFAVAQIADNVGDVVSSLARANIAALVDFNAVRNLIAQELKRIVPTRVRTEMSFDAPIDPFLGIFIPAPIGAGKSGRFAATSLNVIDFGPVLEGEAPRVEAAAQAELSPFEIRLLGGFDALTLVFSAARMSWTAGSEPQFDIDFVDFKIGKELEFIEELAASLTGNGGGAYVRRASGMVGIEAGYAINIPSINLGGATFMNVGLSASAVLPFEKKPAALGASLSTRDSPFMIIAGIWGGGGHFAIQSDGRRIVGFDASFVFGGGGALSYGALTIQARISVGISISKVGSYTEISGDFFAGGSGHIAIFSISTSLTVTIGQDGTGAMTGSAVFRYSFSVGFAKIRFAITVWKKEGKGFSTAGKTASLRGGPILLAQAGNTPALSSTPFAQAGSILAAGPTLHLDVQGQDENYATWRSYFSSVRSVGYY